MKRKGWIALDPDLHHPSWHTDDDDGHPVVVVYTTKKAADAENKDMVDEGLRQIAAGVRGVDQGFDPDEIAPCLVDRHGTIFLTDGSGRSWTVEEFWKCIGHDIGNKPNNHNKHNGNTK